MIAAALIFEASTPFVSLRSVLSQLDGMRSSRLYMINGIAMVVAFFCCRILIYPIFYKIYGKYILNKNLVNIVLNLLIIRIHIVIRKYLIIL